LSPRLDEYHIFSNFIYSSNSDTYSTFEERIELPLKLTYWLAKQRHTINKVRRPSDNASEIQTPCMKLAIKMHSQKLLLNVELLNIAELS
jgi:hypothetical protein